MLDFEGIAYRERVLGPGTHLLVTRRLAPRSEVPVLVHDDRVVQGSGAILDCVADRLGGRRLTPADPARRAAARDLEQRVDRALGRGVQRVLYAELLADRATLIRLWAERGPPWARTFLRVAHPLVALGARRRYRTDDPAAVADAAAGIVAQFDALDELLARQPYLGGDAPDRVDLTLAALLAPLSRPPEHFVPWPPLPSGLDGFVARLRDRPSWRHGLRMYRWHRRAPAPA